MLQDVVLSDAMEAELVDGRGVRKVSPKRKHGLVQGRFVRILERCAAGRGEVIPEWRCVLEPGIDEFVPDVAFMSYDRLRALSEEEREEPPLAPEVVVEVRSPSDKASVRLRKIAKYLAHGSLIALDVDPQSRTIVAHEGCEAPRTYACGERLASATLPWLAFAVSDAFATLDMPGEDSREV